MKIQFVAQMLPAAKLREGLSAFTLHEIPCEPLAVLALEPQDLRDRLGLCFQDSFDELDRLQLSVVQLPSRRKIALIRHLNAQDPGTLVTVDPHEADDAGALAEIGRAFGLADEDFRWRRGEDLKRIVSS